MDSESAPPYQCDTSYETETRLCRSWTPPRPHHCVHTLPLLSNPRKQHCPKTRCHGDQINSVDINCNACSVWSGIDLPLYLSIRKFEIQCPPSSPILRRSLSLTKSGTTSLELMSTPSRNGDGKVSKNRRILGQQARQLRNHCDRILDRSIPLVLETNILILVTSEIYSLLSNNPTPLEENAEETKYQDQVMFIHDVFEQTPSLCVSLSETGHNSFSILEGNYVDLTLFHNLEFLELRKVEPHTIIGLNTVKKKLKRLKCCRCLDSLEEILSEAHSSSAPIYLDNIGGRKEPNSNITCVWPELKEIDFSFNRLGRSASPWSAFELTPCVENLNLSRNLISTIDEIFSKTLPSLTTLNLSYNKLTQIPPIPPNVKVLILAHNCITFVGNKSLQHSTISPGINPNFGYAPGNSSYLRNLETLDLSTNMIAEESEIVALELITGLKCLSLFGNPLSYLDNYRHTVITHLNRACVSRAFILDKKKLSNSEVRWNKEQSKNPRFTPFIPVVTPDQGESTSSGINSSFVPKTKHSNLKQLSSMTQSYDSTTSSVRSSSSRKKPKIREMVDFKDSKIEAKEDGVLAGVSKVLRPKKSNNKSSGRNSSCSSVKSTSSSDSNGSDGSVEVMTKQRIASLREKYGPENWLLRQAGNEVSKLLGIEETTILDVRNTMCEENTTCQNCGNFCGEGDSLGTLKDSPDGSVSMMVTTTACVDVHSSPTDSNCTVVVNSPEEVETIKTPDNNNTPSSTSVIAEPSIFACNDVEESSIRPLTTVLNSKESKVFNIFHLGDIRKLAVNNGYLYEVDPDNMQCFSKWDLKSLQSLIKEPVNADTDTVKFSLKFDTMRKTKREKSFVMAQQEFCYFNDCVFPFIQENTLHEFAEAMQCMKCNAQFCKAMAVTSVKQGKNGVPKEILVCPNPDCESDMLVTLDVTPLPNDECFDVGRELDSASPILSRRRNSRKSSSSGRKSTTPVTISGSPGVLDSIKQLASSLTHRASKISYPESSSYDDTKAYRPFPAHKNFSLLTPTTGSSCETIRKTKSDSDIEVLSCDDSSSIEVLAKQGGTDSGSDIEVEEAVELDMPDYQTQLHKQKPGVAKNAQNIVPMSESTSSDSCTGSTCTTLERKIPIMNISCISSPLSQPLSGSTSFSSMTSPGPFGLSNPFNTSTTSSSSTIEMTPKTPPIKYDYENFSKVDHRLQLFCEVIVFKSSSEKLLALTKALVLSETQCFISIVIFSSRKLYLYKIIGDEGDRPQDWLQKINSLDLSKFSKLDVLIGRHGVGLDVAGKYYVMLFRDSQRTSNFLEAFMNNICSEIEIVPMVRDFSQAHKALMSPKNPISYFGVLRYFVGDCDKSYPVCAIVLTNEELILVADLTWMVVRCETVIGKHTRKLSTLRQIECLENDGTFIRLVFEIEKFTTWEMGFETDLEKDLFIESLNEEVPEIQSLCLSQPLEP